MATEFRAVVILQQWASHLVRMVLNEITFPVVMTVPEYKLIAAIVEREIAITMLVIRGLNRESMNKTLLALFTPLHMTVEVTGKSVLRVVQLQVILRP